MPRFSLPQWIAPHLIEYSDYTSISEAELNRISAGLARFKNVESPKASICIPAYNEELNIVRTLSSLSALETKFPIELLVINNNSSDKTTNILDRLGVTWVNNPVQGISFTRQMGLDLAKGEIILNADADSIYPPGWADGFILALGNQEVKVAYGRYSFIPSMGNTRFELGLYELLAETLFDFRSIKRAYLNVMGFNFAFRRFEGIKVGGFNTTRPRWSDGWMAMSLQNLGKIKCIRGDSNRVYTSDRRLVADGTLRNALVRRIKKELSVFAEYVLPGQKQEAKAVKEKISRNQS